MARIKGKWVGQVVVEYDYIDYEDRPAKIRFERLKDYLQHEMKDDMVATIAQDYAKQYGSVTVTQLHADLYRDEPSEWTKEEETP